MYEKTTWIDNLTPLNAANMNKIENGIKSLEQDIEALNESSIRPSDKVPDDKFLNGNKEWATIKHSQLVSLNDDLYFQHLTQYEKETIENFMSETQDALDLKADKTQEAWIAPTLINGWVASNDAITPVRYYKDTTGVVRLKGRIKNGSSTSVFALPVGYRNIGIRLFTAWDLETSSPTYVVVSDGVIAVWKTSTGGISLDGITFRAEA